MPDVDAAVAVEIHTVLVIFRRQELGEPGGAGPGRAHILARHGTLAEDFERQDEFGAVLILAAADIGLRRHHTHGIIGQRVAAEIGLAAPDRQHNGCGDAEARFDRVQCVPVFLRQPLPLGRKPRDGRFLDVVGGHLHELGLRQRAGSGTSGQDQIGQLVVGLKASRLGIERRARDAGSLRFGPERGDEICEAGVTCEDWRRQ